MKTIDKIVLSAMLIAFLTINTETFAQVGIGTLTPDVSSMIDMTSTTKGMLAPRMTTAQKNAITTPASGLLVYDTTLGKFSYYTGSAWVTMEANTGRDNYVLVKTLADFPAPVSGVITLVAGTMYEINGTINLGANSINLNGCTLVGSDPSSDKLNYTGSGSLFTGTNGGIIEFIFLSGNAGSTKLFNVSDATETKNFIVRDCFVYNFGEVGTVSGHNFVFFDSLNFNNNGTGVTFSANEQLHIYTMIWNTSNTGTALTLIGEFNMISIIGGKMYTDSGETGVNVGSTPTIISDAVINSVSFSGSGSRKNGTFSKEWEIDTSGLNTEKDDVATGNIYITASAATAIISSGQFYKVNGTTGIFNNFRVDDNGASNRLRYIGTKTRTFSFFATMSVSSSNSPLLAFYIVKNAATYYPSSKAVVKIGSGSDVVAVTMTGTITLSNNDYVEIWVINETNTFDPTVQTMNFHIK